MMETKNTNEEIRSFDYIDRNLSEVRESIRRAELASGRTVGSAVLMAAIKSADAEEINYLTQTLGVRDVGENRVQQLLSRYDEIAKHGVRLHFIGSLQKNKVKYIIDKVCAIHSVDSVSLAREIDKRAAAIGKVMDVFAEINSGREENKGGLLPEEASAFAKEIDQLPNIRLVGFMTMAPHCEDPKEYHKYFSETRALAVRIFKEELGREEPPVLSMGMSESFSEAIEEGADIVRVGRRLFLKD